MYTKLIKVIPHACKLLPGLMLIFTIAALTPSCDTEGEYEISDTYNGVRPSLSYVADTSIKFRFEVNDIIIGDSIPNKWDDNLERIVYPTNDAQQRLTVWRYLNKQGDVALALDTVLDLNQQTDIKFLHFGGDGDMELMPQSTLADTDTTKTSLFLTYGGIEQPDMVYIDVLAVDFFSLIMAGYNISNVADQGKKALPHLKLKKYQLSHEVIVDINCFRDINYGLPAQFYYAVYDARDNSLIQDFNASYALTPEYTSNPLKSINRLQVINLPYRSETELFGYSNTIISEKWE